MIHSHGLAIAIAQRIVGYQFRGVQPGLNKVRDYVIVPAYTYISQLIHKDLKKITML